MRPLTLWRVYRGNSWCQGCGWKLWRSMVNEPDDSGRPTNPRVPLDGVLLVSVGKTRDETPLVGAIHAHVARLHDLPSLIHACVPGDK